MPNAMRENWPLCCLTWITLRKSCKSISFPKNSRVNQIIDSVIKGKAVVATGLEEIASPFISSKVCSTVQKFSQAEKHIVLRLKQGTTVVGALLVASPRRNFAREELRMLQTVAHLAAEAGGKSLYRNS